MQRIQYDVGWRAKSYHKDDIQQIQNSNSAKTQGQPH